MNSGKLYLVATPIGNLKDITLRAVEVLKNVDLVLCEDTRYSARLFKTYGITTPRDSYHDFNKEKKTPRFLHLLKQGENLALISDAGTPGIQDPAYYLVTRAIAEGIEVTVIPGASAVISALVISGLPTDRFVFEGFLPRKQGKRSRRLQELSTETRTMIFCESPARLVRTLGEFREVFGPYRKAVIVRELTKLHEEIQRGTIAELQEGLNRGEGIPKGEIIIVMEGRKNL